MSESIRRLETWLSANRPDYLASLSPGTTRERLHEFENRFGLSLPRGFRDLYSWRNGQASSCYENFHDNWMFSSLEDITESKEIFDGMIGSDFDDPRHWRRGWIPFLGNGGGSHLCVDLEAVDGGHRGQIIEFWKADADRPVKYSNFDDWLSQLVQSMESGTYEYL